ncbi:MAG TPA: FAD-dependent oxidoreductase [Actinomycetota bacterium]|nr:FAD-dependent oxidoreductase [Actinomycetota bacterium]
MTAVRYVDRLPRSCDLVVVGGGVVGAATAFYAAGAGLDVLLVERRPALCTLTTPASTGAFRLQFDNLEELELVRESVELFLDFREVTRQDAYDLGIRQQGYLFATTDPGRAEWQRDLVARQHEWGQTDIEILDGDEVRRRWPWVAPGVVQARWRADDGFLDPKELTFGLAAGSGAAVMVGTAVTGFVVERDRLAAVRTSAGEVSTPRAVIACGPLSGELARAAGAELPIQTVTRHKLVLPDVPEVPQDAPMTIDDDTGAHWRPALRGASVLFTDPRTPPSPPTDRVPTDPGFAFEVLSPDSPTSVGRIAPFWNDVWDRGSVLWMLQSGQYTNTPDHRPLLGPLPVEGVFVNTGYSGHGIMGSPAGSRHLVDVVLGKISPEANPFRVDRTFETRTLDRL